MGIQWLVKGSLKLPRGQSQLSWSARPFFMSRRHWLQSCALAVACRAGSCMLISESAHALSHRCVIAIALLHGALAPDPYAKNYICMARWPGFAARKFVAHM